MAKKLTDAEMRQDFIQKNIFLSGEFVPVSPYAFVSDIWVDQEQLMMIIEDDMYKVLDVDEVLDFCITRNDVYIPPCSFLKGCYRNKTADELFAFVIDIDNLSAWGLEQVVRNQLNNTIPLPTYIVNSGSGVHFYYVVKKPIPFYNVNREQLKKIYNRLWYVCDRNIGARVEKHNLIQPYRLPGSLTKLDQVAAAYAVNDKWDIDLLMERLGIEEDPVTYWDPLGYKKVKTKRKTYPTDEAPNGDRYFYDYCYERVLDKTVEGHRYYSMYALSVVAYKTNVPYEELKEDLEFLLQKFNATGAYMKHKELEKALKGYTPARRRTKSETLEDWFGWNFKRPEIKTNGRTREAHQAYRRGVKLLKKQLGEEVLEGRPKGSGTAEQKVLEWRQKHPEGKKADCIRATGLSKPTVYKWWKKEEEM